MDSFLETDFMQSSMFITGDKKRINNLVTNVQLGVCTTIVGEKGVLIIPKITENDSSKDKILYLIPKQYLSINQLNLL